MGFELPTVFSYMFGVLGFDSSIFLCGSKCLASWDLFGVYVWRLGIQFNYTSMWS